MPAKLSNEEAHQFLDSRPGWLILTTIGRDGYPHSIPIGYFRLGDEIYVGGRAGTQRAKNIERDQRVSALVESGGTMQEIKGLMIQGEASLISDPAEVLRLMRVAATRRGTPEQQLPTEPQPGVTYIRITPRRYISWDYTREG